RQEPLPSSLSPRRRRRPRSERGWPGQRRESGASAEITAHLARPARSGRLGSAIVFSVTARCPHSRARTGTLHLAHGEVRTPAFIPLATRGAVKTLEPRDVEALGYEMILGNTFRLFLAPGHDLVRELGGLNELMRWPRPIITDSGG